jgi:probable biosynthetic protein (TIGR04099 family)
MNVAILDFHPPEPSARELMERALEPYILIGMPHLTPYGLSETWLMKELGHRHWLLLARHMNMNNADFRTSTGDEAYAAICATSLQGAQLDRVKANDVLAIRSTFEPVSRTQISTRHRLSASGLTIGDIELISTFVHRTIAGDNHSIARISLSPSPGQFGFNALESTAAELRGEAMDVFLGMNVKAEAVIESFCFEPSRLQEFNGAGLFYFAEFQAAVTRAFGHWFLHEHESQTRTVRRRDVFFSGNVQPGETLVVELMDTDATAAKSFCRIKRPDGKIIARIFTLHA